MSSHELESGQYSTNAYICMFIICSYLYVHNMFIICSYVYVHIVCSQYVHICMFIICSYLYVHNMFIFVCS